MRAGILYELIFFKGNFSRFHFSDNIFVILSDQKRDGRREGKTAVERVKLSRRPMLRASLVVAGGCCTESLN